MQMFLCGAITDRLYTLDRTTGIGTAVGNANAWGVSEGNAQDLAWDGETFFMLSSSFLYTVDILTGIATLVGSAANFGLSGTTIEGRGLSWDGTNLFMVATDDDSGLYTLDRTTGVGTRIGDLRWAAGFSIDSSPVAIEWNGSVMYYLSNDWDRLFLVDRTTGALTSVGNATEFGIDERGPQAMAWDGETMFMTGTSLDALLSLDLVTGRGTRIGTADDYDVSERFATGMAWQVDLPEPEPTIEPEPQFDGYEEFTELYDIKRVTGGETVVVAEEVEMLIETGVESAFFQISVITIQEALALHTLTPRYPVAGVLVGDTVALTLGGQTFTVTGFGGVGTQYRQQIVVE